MAIVAGRYEGSADWAMIFIITPHGLYQYNATSVDPQRDAVQID